MTIISHSLITRWLVYQCLGFALCMAIYFFLIFGYIERHIRADAEKNAGQYLMMIADTITGHPDLFNREGLEFLIQSMAAKIPSLEGIVVTNHALQVVADSQGLSAGAATDKTMIAAVIREGREQTFEFIRGGRPYLRLTRPILGHYDKTRRSNIIGAVSATVSLAVVRENVWEAQIAFVALLTVFFLVVIALQYAFMRLSLRPLHRLTTAVHAFGRGEKAVFPDTGLAELDVLTDSLDEMRLKLLEQTARRENIEAALLESNRARQKVQSALEAEAERVAAKTVELEAALDSMKRRSDRMALLGEMGGLLQTCRSLEEACVILGNFLERMLPGWTGALYLAAKEQGMAAVKHGGVTIVQDPKTAEAPEMPRAAIDAGTADLVLSLQEIVEYIKNRSSPN